MDRPGTKAAASRPTQPRAPLVGVALAGVALVTAALGQSPDPSGPLFADTLVVSRVAFRHAASKTAEKYLPETMGGGVAVFDYNNDGRLDLFFTNGARLGERMTSARQPDKRDPSYWNRLYLSNGDGSFSETTERAGVAGTRYDFGVAVGDVDRDGFEDLFVTGYGGNTLYRNNGNGTFADVTARAGVGGGGWSSSAGFFDYDNDGDLDLFVCRYLTWTWETNLRCGLPPPNPRDYCSPSNFKGIENLLYRNNGDGTFLDVSKAAGIANPEGKALGVAFNDFDDDGWTDVFVANDGVRQFLYRNNGNGTFTDVGLEAGVGFTDTGKAFAGMGADFEDYDNDGRPDIIATALSNEMYALFRNTGDGGFAYATGTSGVGEATVVASGWGAKFADFDNDGLKDLFVAQSHVLDTIEHTQPTVRYLQSPLLLKNTGSRFVDVSKRAGRAFAETYPARGAAFGDLDNDGDVDVVMSNLDRSPVILRNDTANRNHWLTIALVGRKSNRHGIGARVKVVGALGRAQYVHVSTASSYQSANDRRAHFGLGADAVVRSLEVRWPGGAVQRLGSVAADQVLVVEEPAPQPGPKP